MIEENDDNEDDDNDDNDDDFDGDDDDNGDDVDASVANDDAAIGRRGKLVILTCLTYCLSGLVLINLYFAILFTGYSRFLGINEFAADFDLVFSLQRTFAK